MITKQLKQTIIYAVLGFLMFGLAAFVYTYLITLFHTLTIEDMSLIFLLLFVGICSSCLSVSKLVDHSFDEKK